jgi:hypothetical protein
MISDALAEQEGQSSMISSASSMMLSMGKNQISP